jgi:hypothetical protein
MRFLTAAGASLLLVLFPVPAQRAEAQTGLGSPHRLTAGQTRQIARLVARHDRIDLSDTHIEINSMDLGAAFIPGYSSFIVIRESSTPGPDETLRRYAINRRTGDVWEMTLCTHYDFPELTRMRRAFALRGVPAAGDVAAESRELGCSEQRPGPAS